SSMAPAPAARSADICCNARADLSSSGTSVGGPGCRCMDFVGILHAATTELRQAPQPCATCTCGVFCNPPPSTQPRPSRCCAASPSCRCSSGPPSSPGMRPPLLAPPHPGLRAAALRPLAGAAGRPALQRIGHALNDPERQVRLAAVEALRESVNGRDWARWVHVMFHPDPDVRL